MVQLVGNTNSPEQNSQSGLVSTDGPLVQPYSKLLLALGICYQTGPGSCLAVVGGAAAVGETSMRSARCRKSGI